MQKVSIQNQKKRRVAVIPVNETIRADALKVAQLLREEGIPTELEVMGRKMNKALEDADKKKIDYAVILGERELKQKSVVLRDLKKREQSVVEISKLAKTILG